ncbi:helix-turn-helix domain-containing protein [Odoribacter lunatus]|uniref:helix-turn-helix domain-containing protein n=1 Tax=Odoribacter lunatus TaxID=2941335 RepID=UPI00203B8A8D|nr:AraC family transcriptional regulator [Odoribacter lunatus]
MEVENPFVTTAVEPFAQKTDNLASLQGRLCKTGSIVVLICLQGEAVVTIDLHKYSLAVNTFMFLFSYRIVGIESASKDFLADYFVCSEEMFWKTSFRFEPQFFRFIKEHPCYTPPLEQVDVVKRLINSIAAIYEDRQNRFRNQIAKKLMQIFLMDLYDKTCRWFSLENLKGLTRRHQLFQKFTTLVHTHITTSREVAFYAENLCISTKYLTDICRYITGMSAKKIIDDFSMLEIKFLLTNPELSIQDICDRLHFPDQSYLGRYFKRHEKISLTAYRNLTRENNSSPLF